MQTNIKLSYLYWQNFAVNQTEPRPDGAGPFLSLCGATLEAAQQTHSTWSTVFCNRVFQYLDHFSTLSPLLGMYVYMCDGLP